MALKMKLLIFFSLLLVLCSLSAIQVQAIACTEQWDCTAWGSCSGGISSRRCMDLNLCGTTNDVPTETAQCSNVLPYCYDGIINQDESDIDCGGKICDACRLGKACFRDNDCSEGFCINNICAYDFEQGAFSAVPVTPAAPIISLPSLSNILLAVTAIVLVVAIIIVLIMLIKKLRKSAWRFQRCTNFQGLSEPDVSERLRKSDNFQWPFWKGVSKRLKKQKIIIISDKKEAKEEIKKIISVNKMTKKSKASKFFDNFNGYLKSIKPELKKARPSDINVNRATSSLNDRATSSLHQKKDLLNENNSKIREHPAKDFMLSNLKEVYDNG